MKAPLRINRKTVTTFNPYNYPVSEVENEHRKGEIYTTTTLHKYQFTKDKKVIVYDSEAVLETSRWRNSPKRFLSF